MSNTSEVFDVVVIGGGPGGYVCAIRSAQLGLKTACIEKRSTLGGTCLNEGCIPSKFLLNQSHRYFDAKYNFHSKSIKVGSVDIDAKLLRDEKDAVVKQLCNGIDFLFKKNKITRIIGVASIKNDSSDIKEIIVNDKDIIRAKNIVIATGSETIAIPNIEFDEKQILSSTGILELDYIPKSLVIVGGGVIGLEMASVWVRLGSKVTVLEGSDSIIPAFDNEVSKTMQGILSKQGIEIKLNSMLSSVDKKKDSVNIKYKDLISGSEHNIEAERLLISIGRKPYIKGLNLNAEISKGGQIVVDDTFQVKGKKNIYAIGDVIDGPMLAHKSSEEGIAVAEIISGKKPYIAHMPSVIYTSPEAAFVGLTEQELKKKNVKYSVGKFPFSACSRAKVNGETDGFVKVIVVPGDKKILGIHILGQQAGTMIAEACLALDYKASAEDIAVTCHSHPDLPEALKEAALQAFDKAIHM